MKSLKISILAILVTSLFLPACKKENTCIQGQGPLVIQTIDVPDFTGIDLSEASNLTISLGPTQEVKVTGQANIISLVQTKVSNNIWNAALEDGCYENYSLSFDVTVPNINSIDLSGSGNILVNDFFTPDDFSIDLSGSGNITLNAIDGTENLSINMSGSGNIEGNDDLVNLKKLTIDISGSGAYTAFPIETDQCEINISGSGNCSVYVRDILDVEIPGSGNVFYKGNPTITSDITGSGSIIDAN